MNEILWFVFIFIDLFLALLVFRVLGKLGLYALIIAEIIICNIQVIKTIELFGVTTTLGNIAYASIFWATDVLHEIYGEREARIGVWLGFYGSVLTAILMFFAIKFIPAPSDFAHPHLEVIFGFMPRVVLASWIAYIISQHHDVWAYGFWKRRTKGRLLWLRNNASTMVSQLIDTSIFCTIAFYGVFEKSIFWQIFLTTYFLKWFIAILDTPFIYLAVRMHRRYRPLLNSRENS